MRIFAKENDLDGHMIDLVVRPGVRLTRLDVKDGYRSTSIAAKASVMVFLGEKWKENQRKFDKAIAGAIASTNDNHTLLLIPHAPEGESRHERKMPLAQLKTEGASLAKKVLKRYGEAPEGLYLEKKAEVCLSVNSRLIQVSKPAQELDFDSAVSGPIIFNRAGSAPPGCKTLYQGPGATPTSRSLRQGDNAADPSYARESQETPGTKKISEQQDLTQTISHTSGDEQTDASIDKSTQETASGGPHKRENCTKPASKEPKDTNNRESGESGGTSRVSDQTRSKEKVKERQEEVKAHDAGRGLAAAGSEMNMDGQKENQTEGDTKEKSKSRTCKNHTSKTKQEGGGSMENPVELGG